MPPPRLLSFLVAFFYLSSVLPHSVSVPHPRGCEPPRAGRAYPDPQASLPRHYTWHTLRAQQTLECAKRYR